MNEMTQEESRKTLLLKNFARNRELFREAFLDDVVVAGEDIICILKQKELTYEEAYAALEVAYIQLKHEANFLTLPTA